jgi:uncharacterized protein (DUF1800 family)
MVRLLAVFVGAALLVPLSVRAEPAATDRQIIHLLNRITFGPTASLVAHVKAIGIDHYIDEQLDPASLPEPAALTERLAPLDTLKLGASQLFAQFGPPSEETSDGMKQTQESDARMKRDDSILQQARAARLYRAIYSPRQLQEVMVDFWFNHFNIYAYEGYDLLWIGNYEAEAIRPNALGKFRDLLLATARHPAMLYFLNNEANTAPGSPNAHDLFSGLNENYAREIMELHTVGVDGGYTQQDVTTLARIFTGWGFDYADLQSGSGAAFAFDLLRHDASAKTFLGQSIPAGGEEQGVAAIDILSRSPATAHHIAFELAQYFVADNPPATLVDRLAKTFLDSDGDIKVVLKTLLTSDEFRGSVGQKYKTPYQYVISAVRAGDVDVRNVVPLWWTMERLGMPLYLCQTPDGYKNTEAAWLNPAATTVRVDFASLLGSGAFLLYAPEKSEEATKLVADRTPAPALKPRPIDVVALEKLLSPTLGEQTRNVVTLGPNWLKAALVLGSPDFMRR